MCENNRRNCVLYGDPVACRLLEQNFGCIVDCNDWNAVCKHNSNLCDKMPKECLPPKSKKKKGMTVAMVIIGILIALHVFGAFVYFLKRRRQRETAESDEASRASEAGRASKAGRADVAIQPAGVTGNPSRLDLATENDAAGTDVTEQPSFDESVLIRVNDFRPADFTNEQKFRNSNSTDSKVQEDNLVGEIDLVLKTTYPRLTQHTFARREYLDYFQQKILYLATVANEMKLTAELQMLNSLHFAILRLQPIVEENRSITQGIYRYFLHHAKHWDEDEWPQKETIVSMFEAHDPIHAISDWTNYLNEIRAGNEHAEVGVYELVPRQYRFCG